MTTTAAAPAATAGQLLAERGCTPACLLAHTARCRCPCGGSLHGALTTAPVPDPGRKTDAT